MSHDVFISYSSTDKEIADALCHALEDAEIKCWIAPRDVRPGDKFAKAITNAIRTCRVMLLVYTKDSNASEFVYREVDLAAKNKKTIIPFLVDDEKKVPMNEGFEFYFNADHWLAAYPNWRSKFSELIRIVKDNLGVITPPPPPPGKKWWKTALVAVGRQRKKIALAIGACVLVAALAWAGYHFGVRTPTSEKRVANVANTQSPIAGKAWTVPELNLEMVPIPAGSFQMGGNPGKPNETPVHTVRITKPFWLGKDQVTQGQWEALMGNNPSDFKNAGKNAPVENVSWDEAMEFCRKLTEREHAAGRLPGGYEFTLPTEAQWEYACRAGTTGNCAGPLAEMGWDLKNDRNQTHPVGQKMANAWGLYDMYGNVQEWCRDWYGSYYYANSSGADPTGPASGTERVNRGGWEIFGNLGDSARRDSAKPGERFKFNGFRLALSAVGGDAGK